MDPLETAVSDLTRRVDDQDSWLSSIQQTIDGHDERIRQIERSGFSILLAAFIIAFLMTVLGLEIADQMSREPFGWTEPGPGAAKYDTPSRDGLPAMFDRDD